MGGPGGEGVTVSRGNAGVSGFGPPLCNLPVRWRSEEERALDEWLRLFILREHRQSHGVQQQGALNLFRTL